MTGNSGSGKTEAVKTVIEFLTKCGQENTSLHDKAVACSSVLEAFGNACTSKNCNSSRSGKYVKLLFDTKQRIFLGLTTKSFLLEKSRVISQVLILSIKNS